MSLYFKSKVNIQGARQVLPGERLMQFDVISHLPVPKGYIFAELASVMRQTNIERFQARKAYVLSVMDFHGLSNNTVTASLAEQWFGLKEKYTVWRIKKSMNLEKRDWQAQALPLP